MAGGAMLMPSSTSPARRSLDESLDPRRLLLPVPLPSSDSARPSDAPPSDTTSESGVRRGELGMRKFCLYPEGRGFTVSELKLAGIRKKEAKGLGIVFDHRRRSKSEEGQSINVERLKEYRSRLVVFPRKAGKPKSGDAQVRLLLESTELVLTTRARTSPHTSPELSPPSPPRTPPRPREPSPRRRRSSTLSEPTERPEPRSETLEARSSVPRPRPPRRLPRSKRLAETDRTGFSLALLYIGLDGHARFHRRIKWGMEVVAS